MLSGNPLRCGCAVSWLGAWLRRWAGEVGGGARAAREAARAAGACERDGELVPLLALEEAEEACAPSALSARASLPHPPPTSVFLLVLLVLR